MLKGHAVTLTFIVATQMLRATRHLNMVITSVKHFRNSTSNNQSYRPDKILLQGHAVTLTFKVATSICARHVVSTWWSFL